MEIGTFRKNVMKTVATKPAKLGLRVVSKNTIRTTVAHATVALGKDAGQLLRVLSAYVLGAQFSQEMTENAFPVMGDIGYDLTVLCRQLKVKMPTATKKIKLTGSRTAALLQLSALSTDLLETVEKGLFSSPAMKTVEKTVTLPNKNGAKEQRMVPVVDTEAENTAENERQAKMKSILSAIVDIYWRLSFDIFKQPPKALFEDKFARMQKEHPEIKFDLNEEPEETKPAEDQAPAPAGEAPAVA